MTNNFQEKKKTNSQTCNMYNVYEKLVRRAYLPTRYFMQYELCFALPPILYDTVTRIFIRAQSKEKLKPFRSIIHFPTSLRRKCDANNDKLLIRDCHVGCMNIYVWMYLYVCTYTSILNEQHNITNIL